MGMVSSHREDAASRPGAAAADCSGGAGAEAPPLVGWYPAPVALGMASGDPQRERTQLGCGLWVLVVCSQKARSAGSK